MSGPRGRAAAAAGGRRCPGRAGDAARRAARLLGWYPKTWRSRYGEEFTELLISDIGERPRSAWALTLSVSSFWAHPAALAAFPAAELAWMAASPLAVACAVAGAATAVRRTELSPGVLRLETRLGTAACAMMAVFLGACWAWVADGVPGPGNLFRAGTIDVAGVVVMTVALAAAWQAARHARRAARQSRAAAA